MRMIIAVSLFATRFAEGTIMDFCTFSLKVSFCSLGKTCAICERPPPSAAAFASAFFVLLY